MFNKKEQSGFTIVEVMITVAILSMVVALALPTYQNYLFKARRVDASNALLRIHAEQEKFYFDNNSYMSAAVFATQNTANGWFDSSGTGVLSENGYYAISIAVNGTSFQDGFSATATPVAGGLQSRDAECTSLSINSSGQRAATGSYSDACWK